jgi:hypothetical protein
MRSNAPLERVIDPTDLLTYYAGIFNGNCRNITINNNNNFMFAGRLELQPFTGKVFGQPSFLKLGGDVLNSRDEAEENISQSSNLLVNDDGSLSPFVLPSHVLSTPDKEKHCDTEAYPWDVR